MDPEQFELLIDVLTISTVTNIGSLLLLGIIALLLAGRNN
jgi:hypothetical protein